MQGEQQVYHLKVDASGIGTPVLPRPKAMSTSFAPSSERPDISLILAATVFVASNTA